MTVAKINVLAAAIYAACEAALVGETPAIPVYDHVQDSPPDRFVRIDAHNLLDISFKNREVADHKFMIHVFNTPSAGLGPKLIGKKEVGRILAKIHAAVMAVVVDGQPVQLETAELDDNEVGRGAHAFARYTITL